MRKKKVKKQPTVDEEEEFELDLNDIVEFVTSHKKEISYVVVFLAVFFAFYVRTQDVPNLQGKYLVGLDPYVFYRYAYYLVNDGSIPSNDTMRYYPTGFLTERELLMPSYSIAALYYTIHLFNPNFSLMDAAIYYPAVATAIAIIFFFFLTREIFKSNTIALSSSLLLAVISGFIFRTSAGFADKEPIATLFTFGLLLFFVKALRAKEKKDKVIFSALTGFFSSMSIMSWGGTNLIFVSIGFALFLHFLLNQSKKEDILLYLFLTLSIAVIPFLTPRYGTLSTIFMNYKFVYFPLLLLLGLYKFYLFPSLQERFSWLKIKGVPNHIVALLSGLLLIFALTIFYPGLSFYVRYISQVLETIANPLGTDPFSRSVSENQQPFFIDNRSHVDWWHNLNFNFVTMLVGSAILFYDMMSKFKHSRKVLTIIYVLTIMLLIFSRFSPDQMSTWNAIFSSKLFGLDLYYFMLLFFLGYIIFFYVNNIHNTKRFEQLKPEYLFLFIWFLVTVIAARGAVRIIFTVIPPAMIMSGYFYKRTYDFLVKMSDSKILSLLFVMLIFISIFLSNFNESLRLNKGTYSSFTPEWEQAMNWVRENTSSNSVFAHWWDYGYWVQTMGNRSTNLDGGNYYVNRDHLIGRYLFASRIHQNGTFNMTEPATVLVRTFGSPNYLLIIDDDVMKYVQMGRIGKRPTYYIPGQYHTQINNSMLTDIDADYILIFDSIYGYFPIQEPFVYDGVYYSSNDAAIVNIVYPSNSTTVYKDQPYGLVASNKVKDYKIAPFDCYCEYEKGCFNTGREGIHACPLLMDDGSVILITQNASDNLFTYLYLLNVSVPGFHLVYDNPRELSLQGMFNSFMTDIKIYEINYTELEDYVLPQPLPDYWDDERLVIW